MKHKPSHDLREDIAFHTMLIKTVPLVSAAVSAAVLPLALHDTFTATALVVYGCAAAGSVLLVLHLRRRARRALDQALDDEAFAKAAADYESAKLAAKSSIDFTIRMSELYAEGERHRQETSRQRREELDKIEREVMEVFGPSKFRDDSVMERLDRLERVLKGWEKGVVPERDWHIMSGGKPLPEHLRK